MRPRRKLFGRSLRNGKPAEGSGTLSFLELTACLILTRLHALMIAGKRPKSERSEALIRPIEEGGNILDPKGLWTSCA